MIWVHGSGAVHLCAGTFELVGTNGAAKPHVTEDSVALTDRCEPPIVPVPCIAKLRFDDSSDVN